MRFESDYGVRPGESSPAKALVVAVLAAIATVLTSSGIALLMLVTR